MHFSTQTTTEYGSILYNWYCMEFREDFHEFLSEKGKLPMASITEQTNMMKEIEDLKSKQ